MVNLSTEFKVSIGLNNVYSLPRYDRQRKM